MTSLSFCSLTKTTPRFHPSTGFFVALGSILLSAVSIWAVNQELATEGYILYSPLWMNFLLWARCLTLPLSIVSLIIWTRATTTKNWRFYVALLLSMVLLFVCGFINYVYVWGGSLILPIETVKYKESTYHLASIVQFDKSTGFYLGTCPSIGFWCEFHEVFGTSSLYYPDSITLEATKEVLIIKVDGDVIYTYDGLQESCTENIDVGCPVDE